MSFSGEVREELYKQIGSTRHCQIAELAAMLHFCGNMAGAPDDNFLQIEAENVLVIRKCFTLLQKTFNIGEGIEIRQGGRNGGYSIRFEKEEQAKRLLAGMKSEEAASSLCCLRGPVNRMLIKHACCQRAYLRGAFLAAGSMSDPGKSNHLEIVCSQEAQALQLQELMQGFEIEAHMVKRKKYFVVYVKEGAGISDFLNVTEAHVALMAFENFRIVKDVRNSVNRRVNCETANIGKTVSAAAKQTEDILFLQERYGLDNLPANLRQMAEARLQYPDAPLRELGACLDPPVGKSGVNHRLRKLCELAESMRQ